MCRLNIYKAVKSKSIQTAQRQKNPERLNWPTTRISIASILRWTHLCRRFGWRIGEERGCHAWKHRRLLKIHFPTCAGPHKIFIVLFRLLRMAPMLKLKAGEGGATAKAHSCRHPGPRAYVRANCRLPRTRLCARSAVKNMNSSLLRIKNKHPLVFIVCVRVMLHSLCSNICCWMR